MDSIFTPLTEEQFEEMFNVADPLIESGKFPYGNSQNEEHQRNVIWNHYKLLSGDKSTPPCTCVTTKKYWAKALDTLHDFILIVDKRREALFTASKNITE
jgi:hypothetical protein